MPKDSIFLKLGPSEYGEYQTINYQMEATGDHKFYRFLDKTKRKINGNSFWQVPSNKEILKMPSPMDLIRKTDLEHLFKLEVDPKSKKMEPNFQKSSQHKVLQKRIPKLVMLEAKDLDIQAREKGRFVEFDQAFTYFKPVLVQPTGPTASQAVSSDGAISSQS